MEEHDFLCQSLFLLAESKRWAKHLPASAAHRRMHRAAASSQLAGRQCICNVFPTHRKFSATTTPTLRCSPPLAPSFNQRWCRFINYDWEASLSRRDAPRKPSLTSLDPQVPRPCGHSKAAMLAGNYHRPLCAGLLNPATFPSTQCNLTLRYSPNCHSCLLEAVGGNPSSRAWGGGGRRSRVGGWFGTASLV